MFPPLRLPAVVFQACHLHLGTCKVIITWQNLDGRAYKRPALICISSICTRIYILLRIRYTPVLFFPSLKAYTRNLLKDVANFDSAIYGNHIKESREQKYEIK